MEKIFIGAWKDKRGIALEDVSVATLVELNLSNIYGDYVVFVLQPLVILKGSKPIFDFILNRLLKRQ